MKLRIAITLCALPLMLWLAKFCLGDVGDFRAFYAAGQLVGTGHLYDSQASDAIQRTLPKYDHFIAFARLPFYAALLKPFTLFNYELAENLWVLLSVGALAAAVALWPIPIQRKWIAFAFLPCYVTPQIQQDSGWFLLFAVLAVRALKEKRDGKAALFFTLCTIKFHFGLLFPVVLATQKRWRTIGVTAASIFCALGLSAVLEGWRFPLHEAKAMAASDQSIFIMPTLRGLTHVLPNAEWFEMAIALFVVAAVYKISRKSTIEVAMASAVAAGMILGRHAYLYDGVLLIPLLFVLVGSRRLISAATLTIAPLVYMWPSVSQWGVAWLAAQLALVGAVFACLLGLAESRKAKTAAVRASTPAPGLPTGETNDICRSLSY